MVYLLKIKNNNKCYCRFRTGNTKILKGNTKILKLVASIFVWFFLFSVITNVHIFLQTHAELFWKIFRAWIQTRFATLAIYNSEWCILFCNLCNPLFQLHVYWYVFGQHPYSHAHMGSENLGWVEMGKFPRAGENYKFLI